LIMKDGTELVLDVRSITVVGHTYLSARLT
jgi:hypothetical protein